MRYQAYCQCHIVPKDVLDRLAKDSTLSASARAAASDSAKISNEIRNIRKQALRLARVSTKLAPTLEPGQSPAALSSAPADLVFDCQHLTNLPGAQVNNPGTSADITVKRAFEQSRSVAEFYKDVFGRNSIDNAGMPLVSSVHYRKKFNNAFWQGTQMVYGDGDGEIFIDFTAGNDVVAHELTHGVTQHSLQLVYTGNAGGLNESMSDCFGSMFRQWSANQAVTAADWLIGHDIIGQAAKTKGITCLRDMANPAAQHCLAPQPTQFSQVTPGMDPHYSSGPPNLAFYTACKAVGGKSWEKVGKVWYRSMTGFGPSPNMTMPAFAKRTRQVAAQIFKTTPAVASGIDKGWKMVGL